MGNSWPYSDIPLPPLLAGFELISLPEAVGILGKKLYPHKWPDPPHSWRLWWFTSEYSPPLGFKTLAEFDAADAHWLEDNDKILIDAASTLAGLAQDMSIRALASIETPIQFLDPLTERRLVDLGASHELWANASWGRVCLS